MYRIGELARACGVKADTLRFYEKNGLISPGIRNESGYRLYGEQDRRRLEFIIRAKSVGFSLADMAGELLALDTNKARVTCQGGEGGGRHQARTGGAEDPGADLFSREPEGSPDICCGGPCARRSTAPSWRPWSPVPLPSRASRP